MQPTALGPLVEAGSLLPAPRKKNPAAAMGLDALLDNLQSGDNAVRQAAEAQYRRASSENFSAVVAAHIDLIRAGAADVGRRRFTAILLRRMLSAQFAAGPAGLSQACAAFAASADGLLQHVFDGAADPHSTKQVIDVLVTMLYLRCRLPAHRDADIAAVWPRLFQSLVANGAHADVARRMAAMELWLQLCVTVNSRVVRSRAVLGAVFNHVQRALAAGAAGAGGGGDPDIGVRVGALKVACCVCLGMRPASMEQDAQALQQFAALFRASVLPTLALALATPGVGIASRQCLA